MLVQGFSKSFRQQVEEQYHMASADGTDKIAPMGLTVDDSNRLILRYLDTNGQRQVLDLTERIERIAAEMVKGHERNYHGG